MRSTGVARAIAIVWVWEFVVALLCAWPAASLVRSAFAGDPDGEALLWRPGGHSLLSFFARDADGLHAALATGTVLLVLGVVASLIPLAILLVAISDSVRYRTRRRLSSVVGPSVLYFRRLGILLVGFGVAQAVVIAAATFVAPLVTNLTANRFGEARSEQLGVATAALFALAVAWLSILHDVARAAVVSRRASPLRSLATAIEATRKSPTSLAVSWAIRGALSFATVALVVFFATRSSSWSTAAFVGLALLHQAAAVVRVALRASWLAVAVRAVQVDAPLAFNGRSAR